MITGVMDMKAPLKDNCFCGYHLVVTRVECMDALMKLFQGLVTVAGEVIR